MREEAAHLGDLDRRLKQALGSPLSGHLKVATVRDGVLVIQAESAAWASQVRFRTPEILAMLRSVEGFDGLRSVRVRTSVDGALERPRPTGPRPRISAGTARTLAAQADAVRDPRLRDVLRRIAGRASRAPEPDDDA